jgi:hypothetical protein
VTDAIDPVGSLRVSSASPAKRPQQATRDKERQGGGHSQEERPDDRDDAEEGEGGLHVDVLA